jgi:microcystin-dependent protein
MSIHPHYYTDWESAKGSYQRSAEAFDGESPFLGEIQIFAGNYAPANWVICDGALLPIASYEALFALLGTTYGGNGTTTFGLPNLNGRVPIQPGTNASGNVYTLGQMGGSETTFLTISNMPAHQHAITGTATILARGDNPGTTAIPSSTAYPAISGATNYYASSAGTGFMGPLSVAMVLGNTGSGIGVNNMMPYMALNYIICVTGGVYPTT